MDPIVNSDVTKAFAFTPGADLSTRVHEAVGAASTAWSHPPIGVFDDAFARQIADALIESIHAERSALLGLATTHELVAELEVRIRLGHGDPDYRTTDG